MLKLVFTVFSLWVAVSAMAQNITEYKTFYAYSHSTEPKSDLIILRQFRLNDIPYYLAAHTETLETLFKPVIEVSCKPADFENIITLYRETPYIKALYDARANSFALQDAGVTHTIPSERGIVLTIDLCPSTHPLDRELFTRVIETFSKYEQPVPLAIAVSGTWIKKHEPDLEWLIQLMKEKKITMDWINHSFTHPTSKTLPLNRNFLLEKGTSIPNEVLQNEICMLEHGLMPSVFFRFPGLVSDQSIFDEICSFGLIPVGSDAWLAKNQSPNAGSIVLIHGNGNEPLGIDKFIELIDKEKAQIKDKNWMLYDLRESIEEKEE